MTFLISLVVLLIYSTALQGQSPCQNQCVLINECPSLLLLVTNKNRTPQEVETLKKAHCGFEGHKPKVCCESDIREKPVVPDVDTPNITEKPVVPDVNSPKECKCTPLKECPSLLALTKKENRTVQETETLGNSSCGFEGFNPMVCCEQEVCKPSAALPDRNSGCCGRYSSKADRIVIFGATAVSVDQYPWLAYIDYLQLTGKDKGRNTFMCGGVLISSKYVMTAAHCVVGTITSIATPIDVRLGEYDTSADGKDCTLRSGGGEDCGDGLIIIPIEKTIPHPEFRSDQLKRNDIALVKMSQLAPYTDIIRPICLPIEDITKTVSKPTKDYMLKVAAWGKIDEKTFGSKIKLHEEVPYKTLEECQTFYSVSRRNVDLWEGQICAGGEAGKDPCKQDSGGPLMYENNVIFEVLGVASFGAHCGYRPNIPDVYTKVFLYTSWVRSVISKEN